MDSLYNLSNELARINNELVSNEGEIGPELEFLLDKTALDFNAKIEQICKWTLNLDGKEEVLEKEIARLKARKKAAQNLKDRLKAYMMDCMTRAGKTKVEFDAFTATIQKNPPSLNITDEKVVPARYLTIVPEQKVIDRRAVLADLKEGTTVPGAELITDKKHLQIR